MTHLGEQGKGHDPLKGMVGSVGEQDPFGGGHNDPFRDRGQDKWSVRRSLIIYW